MKNELDRLRPQVREFVDFMDTHTVWTAEWKVIRTELLRLAQAKADRDELPTAYTSASQSRDYWKERAEKAESELAALKARIAEPTGEHADSIEAWAARKARD